MDQITEVTQVVLTMSVGNSYSESDVVIGSYTFEFFDCSALPITSASEPADFFYRIGTGEGITSMTWDEYTFDDDPRCLVD